MKFKTTSKAIKEGYSNIFSLGYCEWTNMLLHENPVAYTCGTYGWNYDFYDIDGVGICTGYRGMVGKRFPNCRELEKQAEEIHYNKTLTYEKKEEMVRKLLRDAIRDAIKPRENLAKFVDIEID